MRVLVVDTYYPAFTERHYAERPELASANYGEQIESLLARQFGTGDAYARELRALGHDAATVIVNSPPVQVAWAREQGALRTQRLLARMPTRIGYRARDDLPRRIALAQIAEFEPDVVYLQDLWFFDRESLD